ncbi:MAG: hypothetical protein EBT92_00200 [Planctomycetes bacterium]|nr:hypothetical protein [Planctomycetota bacterium]NBY03531.1 hypothetical protein [Planctomycetota bacterium]
MNVDQVIQLITEKKLLSSREVESARHRWFQANRVESADVKMFLKWLVLNKFLSEFQAMVLLSGKVSALKIGNYNVIEIIKSGAYAGGVKVQNPLGELFILQFVKDEVIKDPSLNKKFQGQLQIGLEVKDPHLAGLVDKGESNGHSYIVREFLEGESLEMILARRGKIPHQNAAKILAIVMVAVAHAQEKSVPCGNLLNSDVILAANKNQPKGPKTVKVVTAFISPGMIATEVKVSPEGNVVPVSSGASFTGLKDLTLAEENFRVGKLLYSALAGKLSAEVEGSGIFPALNSLVPEVPEELASLVDQMVSPNVADRPAKITHAAKALRVSLAAEEEAVSGRNEEYIAVPYVPSMPAFENTATTSRKVQNVVSGHTDVSDGDEEFSIKKLIAEFNPDIRDLTFLGLGSVLSLLIVSFLHLITGWHFMSLVCLIMGGVISFSVESFCKWRNSTNNDGESVENY